MNVPENSRPTTSMIPPEHYAAEFAHEAGGLAQATAAKRYLELVKRLGGELNYAPGWRGDVAQRLGISSSLLSQIYSGGKRITRGTLEKALTALKLPHDYFLSPEDMPKIPLTTAPPPPEHVPQVAPGPDPLLIIEAFKVLPDVTKKRLLEILGALTPK